MAVLREWGLCRKPKERIDRRLNRSGRRRGAVDRRGGERIHIPFYAGDHSCSHELHTH